MTTSSSSVDLYLNQLLAAVPEEYLPRVVVFGSAALALRGYDLRRPINDLDCFVSPSDFDEFAQFGRKTEKQPGTWVVEVTPTVELLSAFQGVTFSEVLRTASPTPSSRGVLVADTQAVLAWKRVQGRDKDLNDVRLVEEGIALTPGD